MYFEAPDRKLGIKDTSTFPSDIPEDARWEDLTDEQVERLRNAKRFGCYKPLAYQSVSGIGDCY